MNVVLLMGPLYHLSRAADRDRAIAEAKRVCTPDGTIFFAFISNDMVVLTGLYRPTFFSENTYDHDSFKAEDFPFVFFTLEQMRQMLTQNGIAIRREIAWNGVSELLEDTINALSDEDYAQYVRYRTSTARKNRRCSAEAAICCLWDDKRVHEERLFAAGRCRVSVSDSCLAGHG